MIIEMIRFRQMITLATNDNDWQRDNDNEMLETKADDIFHSWVAARLPQPAVVTSPFSRYRQQ